MIIADCEEGKYWFLKNYNIFKTLCFKYKRNIQDINTDEERLLAYHHSKEYIKRLISDFDRKVEDLE